MAKMNIVLCCAGGFSTTMLMDRIKQTIHNSQKLNDDDFEFKAIAAGPARSGGRPHGRVDYGSPDRP